MPVCKCQQVADCWLVTPDADADADVALADIRLNVNKETIPQSN